MYLLLMASIRTSLHFRRYVRYLVSRGCVDKDKKLPLCFFVQARQSPQARASRPGLRHLLQKGAAEGRMSERRTLIPYARFLRDSAFLSCLHISPLSGQGSGRVLASATLFSLSFAIPRVSREREITFSGLLNRAATLPRMPAVPFSRAAGTGILSRIAKSQAGHCSCLFCMSQRGRLLFSKKCHIRSAFEILDRCEHLDIFPSHRLLSNPFASRSCAQFSSVQMLKPSLCSISAKIPFPEISLCEKVPSYMLPKPQDGDLLLSIARRRPCFMAM